MQQNFQDLNLFGIAFKDFFSFFIELFKPMESIKNEIGLEDNFAVCQYLQQNFIFCEIRFCVRLVAVKY